MLCTFNAQKREFSSLITLGTNVCGHPTIVHGGLTAAIVDETLGGLNYLLKSHGMLDPGPAFTVHMTMDWKKVTYCKLHCTFNVYIQYLHLLAWIIPSYIAPLLAANPCWVTYHMYSLFRLYRGAKDLGEGDCQRQA